MADILHISASPKAARSASDGLAGAFLASYVKHHPKDKIRRLNVFEARLPEFGQHHAEAKFAPILRESRTAEQDAAWKDVTTLIEDFDRADKIVLSCPMWNYSVPWRLKQFIDCIVQPGVTFSYDREKMSHFGLLRNRPVQFLLTRSSTMPGDQNDFQLPYLKFVFSAIGLNDVRVLSAWQTTRVTAQERRAYLEPFHEAAKSLGATF